MDFGGLVVFAHAGGALPHHETMMFLLPALPVLLIGTIIVAGALQARGLLGTADRSVALPRVMTAVAASLSLGAGAIHLAVVDEHLVVDAPSGIFFLSLAAFQAAWAVAYIWRGGTALASIGLLVSAVVIAIWVVSRTTGVPFGPTPGVPQPVGLLDLLATGLEGGLIALLLPLLYPSWYPGLTERRMEYQQAFVLVTFMFLTVAVLTGFALFTFGIGPGVISS